MATAVRIVVRYLNGDVLKGTTQDFYPNRPSFHLLPVDGGPAIEIQAADLKGVFFVKTFEGKPERRKLRGFVEAPPETAQGKKIAIRFKDGEIICGYTLSYTPGRDGFFVSPADFEGNNIRIYVLTGATAEIKAGPAAETLARRVLGTHA
jgi:hypothetical protein